MDLTSNAAANSTTAAIKTPEAESETPPTRIQPPKPLSFTNGVLKRHHPLHHHHPFNNHHAVVVTYRECLKNHAASLGGHAVDGCGEFMPSPTSNPTDPTSLKCAACGCHRNFHRREPDDPLPPPNTTAALEYQPHHRHHPPPPPAPHRGNNNGPSSPGSPSPPPISSSYYPSAPHMLLALSAGLSGPASDSNPAGATTPNSSAAGMSNPNMKKRFRTKFTQDQKERMLEFAERLGWKMQKRDEELINEFCGEVGVDKGVLKVWMHNNKNTFGKRDQGNAGTPPTTTNSIGNGNVTGFTIASRNSTYDATSGPPAAAASSYFHHHNHHHNHHQEDSNDDNQSQGQNRHLQNSDSVSPHHVVATNGSSSSS